MVLSFEELDSTMHPAPRTAHLVTASPSTNASSATNRQHLQVRLKDVQPLGALLPQVGVTASECPEWPTGSDPHF
jgi:hypothetical protein